MRLSNLFTKTIKTTPADETAKNAQLLIQAGFVHKEMAGVYSYLPLGLKVIANIEQIVREEMDAIGGQELRMPALQIKERYELTGRWSDEVVDNWFKTKLANGTEVGLGFSHEENLVPIVKNYVNSYKDLPIAPYQIQTKFRNELRSKSGVMRGREFIMKDMYSFSLTQAQHDEFYEKAQAAYHKVYERLGLRRSNLYDLCQRWQLSKYSHEFQTLSEVGEDIIYLHRAKKIAINKEVLTDDVLAELDLARDELEEVKSIEVGNIFSLADKFSKPFELSVTNEQGEQVVLTMGCYGIGVSRLMGTIAEHFADDKGLVWPENVAPAKVYLVRIGDGDEVASATDELYGKLEKAGVTVLYDDRDVRPGAKFADADLLGIPHRVVISDKTLAAGTLEYKARTSETTDHITVAELQKRLGILE